MLGVNTYSSRLFLIHLTQTLTKHIYQHISLLVTRIMTLFCLFRSETRMTDGMSGMTSSSLVQRDWCRCPTNPNGRAKSQVSS